MLKKSIFHKGAFDLGEITERSRRSISKNCKSRGRLSRDGDSFSQSEINSPFTQIYTRTPWTLDYSTIFSRSTTQELDYELNPFQSTRESFEKWLLSTPDHLANYPSRLGPASLLFRIIHQDTLDLLRLMHSALAGIAGESADSVLQERALHWRYRLDQFRARLLEIEDSLQQFVDFVNPRTKVQHQQVEIEFETNPIEYLFSDVVGQISIFNQRIDQTYSTLTSKVQISDSHRSIAEAETVTRLTELTFLFIPVSFVTSIFGMQIVDGSTPVSTYMAVALSLTSAAYFLRFLIYMTTYQRIALTQRVRNDITAYAKLRPGSRISTSLFFSWLLYYMDRLWQWHVIFSS